MSWVLTYFGYLYSPLFLYTLLLSLLLVGAQIAPSSDSIILVRPLILFL